MKFIDEAIIEITAGTGGNGCVSFRREKYVPRGGPNGGDGGKGGNIVLETRANMSTLLDFRYKRIFEAKHGEHGMGADKNGRASPDLVIPVPIGTVVTDAETDELIADMSKPNQTVVAAKGGRGGKGNAFFKSSTHQAPKFAQDGEIGKSRKLKLELKLLADVGLVGAPNAGKSTLLSVVSEARPKVANYPFTTLQPHLGMVRHKAATAFVMADLPGLIEGAHTGRGMGDRFLKHAERTRVLLHLVSLSPEETDAPFTRYQLIEKEVAAFFEANKKNTKAMKKNQIIVLTKTDLVDDKDVRDVLALFKKHKIKHPIIPISCATSANVPKLLDAITKELGR